MRRLSLPDRLLLLALALALLLGVLTVLTSQHRPATASAPSASPPASTTPSPTPSGSEPSPAPGASPAGASPSDATGTTSAQAGWLTLQQLLALLPIADEHRAGYDRALFPHWTDADGDGCNTRQEVLIGEAVVAPAVGIGCSLTGGTWRSLYDAVVVMNAADLDVDHLVALAEAWDSGASAWSNARRELFANDLDVSWALIAVSASSNRSKSDKDPADWVPPDPEARCQFVSAWIAVKARWTLSVDQREENALADLIVGCADARMPLVLMPTTEPTAAPSTTGECSPAYPTVCIPPPPPDLNCADIAFRRFTVLAPDPHHFDGNHDGIGCESG